EQKDVPARRTQAENEPRIIVDVRKDKQHPVPTAGRGGQSLAGAPSPSHLLLCACSSVMRTKDARIPDQLMDDFTLQPPVQGQGEPWVHSVCCGCFCKNYPRVTAAHRLSVSQHHQRRGVRKATASAWAGQRGRRKEKQSFPCALGHSPMYTLGCSISRACKESKEDLGLVNPAEFSPDLLQQAVVFQEAALS
uniref:Uncharacterized protein n=1 Tax=Cyanoderma ruficeps TaxID=181631 RepID=A0A8C3NNS2_9PASS